MVTIHDDDTMLEIIQIIYANLTYAFLGTRTHFFYYYKGSNYYYYYYYAKYIYIHMYIYIRNRTYRNSLK